MIKVTITDAYGNCGPDMGYETWTGMGMHRRSVKRAVELAKADLARKIRQGGEWAACGTPIYWEMRITMNGKTITSDDGRTWRDMPKPRKQPIMRWVSPRMSQLKAKLDERRAARAA